MRRLAQEILQQSAGRYNLREHRVQVGHLQLDLWSTAGIDELLTEDTDPDEIPYWAELWPSAIALAQTLGSLDELPEMSVLELGCGIGLPSIVARLAGADVTATDYVQDALHFAEANALANSALGIYFRRLDWRNREGLGHFDLVIGADILYERKLHSCLGETLSAAVAAGGRAIIADPCRQAGVSFIANLEDSGWRVEVAEQHLPGTIHELVMVYTLTRS